MDGRSIQAQILNFERLLQWHSFYLISGDRKEKREKIVDKALKAYEEYLKEYFEFPEFDDEEEEYLDEELPF